jgi:ubiquinone/menaquinone biosynthesis C-methylase UbiE
MKVTWAFLSAAFVVLLLTALHLYSSEWLTNTGDTTSSLRHPKCNLPKKSSSATSAGISKEGSSPHPPPGSGSAFKSSNVSDTSPEPAQKISLALATLRSGAVTCNNHGAPLASSTSGEFNPPCVCAEGYEGEYCETHVGSSNNPLISENEKKFDGYTQSICPKKLSTSGRISDAVVRLGAKIVVELFQVNPNAALYDACTGCGGLFLAYREILPNVQLFGCDISDRITKFTAKRFPKGTFISGGCTIPASLFLPDDAFDVVNAGFCLNNIIDQTMQRVYADASKSDSERVYEVCSAVRDLYRITKPGGGIYIPQLYESDARGASMKWKKWPVHLVHKCLPDLDFTPEGGKPACNVRTRGGVVYAFEKDLYKAANYVDNYYAGMMKTVLIYKPIDISAPAIFSC